MSLDKFENNKKGVMFKTCMHCRKNDNKDISIILKKIYREDYVEQMRERSL
jgi:hypothetical protein